MPEARDEMDMLHGVKAIANHLSLNYRKTYHLIEKGGLPAFKIAGVVCARKSSLSRWLSDCEAKAREGRS
jgi:hypothetical protein